MGIQATDPKIPTWSAFLCPENFLERNQDSWYKVETEFSFSFFRFWLFRYFLSFPSPPPFLNMDATGSERQLAEAQADLIKTTNLFGHGLHFNNLLLNFTMHEGSEEGATID